MISSQYTIVLEKLSTNCNSGKKLLESNKLIEGKNNEISRLRAKLNEFQKSKDKSKINKLFVETTIKLNIFSSVTVVCKIKNKDTIINTNESKGNTSFVQPLENSEHNKMISGKIIIIIKN